MHAFTPDQSKAADTLVRRGWEVMTAPCARVSRDGEGGENTKKIHIIAYFCVLDHESVRISGNSDCCKILELFSNREGERASKNPVICRNTICYPRRVPPYSSSPPILQPSILHPPRSQCQTPTRGCSSGAVKTVPSRRADLPPRSAPPKKEPASDLPPRASVSVWSARDGGHRAADRGAISIHSASRPSAQAPHLTGDHNIYHARKLKLKGTGRFIRSPPVTCCRQRRP